MIAISCLGFRVAFFFFFGARPGGQQGGVGSALRGRAVYARGARPGQERDCAETRGRVQGKGEMSQICPKKCMHDHEA